MKGTIFKRGKTYSYVIDMGMNPKTGKKNLKKVDGFLNKYDAEIELKALLLEIHNSLEESDIWVRVPSRPVAIMNSPDVNHNKSFKIWEQDEIDRFLIACMSEKLYVAFLIAIYTGLRSGEILGLRWDDINFKDKFIEVRRSLSYPSRLEADYLTNDYRNRKIPISHSLIKELIIHKDKQKELKLQMGNSFQNNDLVFCTNTGKPTKPAQLHTAFNRIIKAAGVNNMRFEGIRGIYMVNLFSSGVDILTISNLMGHPDFETTLAMYEKYFITKIQ